MSHKRAIHTRFGAIILSLAMSASLAAQGFTMPEVAWKGHNGIGANFNTPQGAPAPWRVSSVRGNEPDHCYLPGAQIDLTLTFAVDDPAGKPLDLAGTLHWVWVGDEKYDEAGGIRYTNLGQESELPLEKLTFAAGQPATTRIVRQAPSDRFGILALFLTTSDGVTRWLTNVAILHPVAKGQQPDSMFFGDARGVRVWQRKLELATMAKLGVKWTRCGESMGRIMPKPGQWKWEELDEEIAAIRDNGMLAIFLGGGAPEWTHSYGRLSWPRDNPKKQDSTPSPEHYGAWTEYWTQVVGRHKDVIRAVNIWNEPWEGGGISNWGGTGAHYRNLQRMAKLGVMRADPTVLVGGNDSDMNVVDNLMCDPSWRDYTDLITVHGGGGSGAGFIHRLIPEGMPIWNTELWYTAFTDRSVQWQMFEAARGVKRMNLVVLSNFFTDGAVAGGYYNPADAKTAPDRIPQPSAVGFNAAAHMLEGMSLPPEQLRPDTMPYQYLFQRQKATTPQASHKAVLVIFGHHIEVGNSPWWQLRAGNGAQARLKLPEGVTGVYDKFGNPYDVAPDGTTVVPFDTQPVYVTADSPEPLRQVAGGLEVLRYERPLHVTVIDPTSPLDKGSEFRLRLANPMPSAITAKLVLRVPEGCILEPSIVDAGAIAAGQAFEVIVKITGPRQVPGGRIPLEIDVQTPIGSWQHTESMQVRRIARFTPAIDGKLDDWLAAGIEPSVIEGSTGASAIAAAMPWEVLANRPDAGAMGRWGMAYDGTYLYLAAQIRTTKRPELPWDQTREDWFELHPGGYAYKRAPEWPFSGENVQLALDVVDNPGDYLYPADDPRHRAFQMRRTDYLFGFYQTRQGAAQAWLYQRPGGAFRHRFPFSPAIAVDQGIAPGVKLVVSRDETSGVTTYEAGIPLALLPELKASPGSRLAGAEVKLTVGRWNGLFSSQGRGASKTDQSVYQPYWATGFSADIPWAFE